MTSTRRVFNKLVHFVVKLLHLAYSAVFFEKDLIHIAALVIVVSYVSIADYLFQNLTSLILLSLFWPVVDCCRF